LALYNGFSDSERLDGSLDFVGLLKHLALHLFENITDVLEIRNF
jgi:hypothetical protein